MKNHDFPAKKIGLFLVFLFTSITAQATAVVNDVTTLNPIVVKKVFSPSSVEEVQEMVASHEGPIAISGGRFSMGGQTATENALVVDMTKMNKVIELDVARKKITVQAGIRWRDILDVIDPVNLSVRIMQTYSNFTVGGSLSVNAHGRYIGQGPLIRSVESFKIVLADGRLLEASPIKNKEIFYGAIGGYGGLGVIVEVTLLLTDNVKVSRETKRIPVHQYQSYFFSHIRDNTKVIFHNGDLYPPLFNSVNAVTYQKTNEELTVRERLIPRNVKYWLQPGVISAISKVPYGKNVRASIIEPLVYAHKQIVWRNYEASHDVAELEPRNRKKWTYVLQEYFVPVKQFDDFVPRMRSVFKKNNVDVINVSIRHSLPDPGSILAWAPKEVFAFVIYYKQGTTPADQEKVARWTREMISNVLAVNGSYYLPYQIYATENQFHNAYPGFREFYDLKKKLDPGNKFRNKLWDAYLK